MLFGLGCLGLEGACADDDAMVRATALMVVAAGSAHVQPHTGPRLMALGTARRVADALEMTIDEFESRL